MEEGKREPTKKNVRVRGNGRQLRSTLSHSVQFHLLVPRSRTIVVLPFSSNSIAAALFALEKPFTTPAGDNVLAKTTSLRGVGKSETTETVGAPEEYSSYTHTCQYTTLLLHPAIVCGCSVDVRTHAYSSNLSVRSPSHRRPRRASNIYLNAPPRVAVFDTVSPVRMRVHEGLRGRYIEPAHIIDW